MRLGDRLRSDGGLIAAATTEADVDFSAYGLVDDAYVATVEFESGAIGTLEASRLATGRINHHAWEINGSQGSLAFDQERMNELLVGDKRGFRTMLVHGDWWPPGHIVGWGDTFTYEYLHLLGAIAGRNDVAPAGATFEDGYRCALVCDAIQRSAGIRTDVEYQ